MDWEKQFDEWYEKYKPIKNHYKENDLWVNDMFETYGEELDFVRAQDQRHIWTLVDGEGGLYITNGYHLINRVNYFVTEVPFEGEFLDVPYYIFEEEN